MEEEKKNWERVLREQLEILEVKDIDHTALLMTLKCAMDAAYRWGVDDKGTEMWAKIKKDYEMKIPF